MAVDSDEEVMVIMWLEELAYAGYILKVERAGSFDLSDGLVNVYEETKELKTKTKTVEKRKSLLNAHIYTAEFVVTFSPEGVKKFVDNPMYRTIEKFSKLFIGTQFVYLEVKPEWDQNNMERLFKINQKWVWEKYETFVNLVKPGKLFEDTFTPKAWLTTPTGKKRVIHWNVRTLDEYLSK